LIRGFSFHFSIGPPIDRFSFQFSKRPPQFSFEITPGSLPPGLYGRGINPRPHNFLFDRLVQPFFCRFIPVLLSWRPSSSNNSSANHIITIKGCRQLCRICLIFTFGEFRFGLHNSRQFLVVSVRH